MITITYTHHINKESRSTQTKTFWDWVAFREFIAFDVDHAKSKYPFSNEKFQNSPEINELSELATAHNKGIKWYELFARYDLPTTKKNRQQNDNIRLLLECNSPTGSWEVHLITIKNDAYFSDGKMTSGIKHISQTLCDELVQAWLLYFKSKHKYNLVD